MNHRPKHTCFYIDTVTFCVEDCLFKVPREPFESESTAFRDMFLLPAGLDVPTEAVEGKIDDNPIQLNGIKKDDFELLLSVLFHRTHGTCQKSLPETKDQWVSILGLADLWGFDNIRQVSMEHLERTMSDVERVTFGQAYNLDFKLWLLPAMREIVQRQKPIGTREGQLLGLETALRLASVRERIAFHGRDDLPHRAKVRKLDIDWILQKTFKQFSPSAAIANDI